MMGAAQDQLNPSVASREVTVIRPPAGWVPVDIADLWRYRELLWLFTLRDIKARYKQTAMGPLWVLLPPLMSTGIFSLILGVLADLPSGGLPYPLFIFAAVLAFNLFSTAFNKTSNCLVANEAIFTKVYFPRLIIPIASAISGIVDFVVGMALLILLMALYRMAPGLALVTAPMFLLLAIVFGMAGGLWLAAFGVRVRDFRLAGSFLAPFLMWISPVMYSSELVFKENRLPEIWQEVYRLNPLYWVVDGFRWSLYGWENGRPNLDFLWAWVIALALLMSGLFYFRRTESSFADVV